MLFGQNRKKVSRELSPFDVVNAAAIKQLFEVVTGLPLTVTAKLSEPVLFDNGGRVHVEFKPLAFYTDKNFNNRLGEHALAAGFPDEHNIKIIVNFAKKRRAGHWVWIACDGLVTVKRPALYELMYPNSKDSSVYVPKWQVDGEVGLVPSYSWTRCGFAGMNFTQRKETENANPQIREMHESY